MIAAEQHPYSCICSFCAPISLPTRSPIVNSTVEGTDDVELAQAAALFKNLGKYERKVALAHLVSLNQLQGKQG